MKLDLALSSEQVGFIFLVTIGLVLLIVFGMRFYAFHTRNINLKEKYAGKLVKSPLKGRNKYPDVDMLSHSGVMFNVSLAITMFLMVGLFSWTSFEEKAEIISYSLEIDETIEVEPPRTQDPPPPPPPPPPSVVVQAVAEELIEEENVEFMDQSIDEESIFENKPILPEPIAEPAAPPPPPPPPPPVEEDIQEIFKVVEEMPSFPGCDNIEDKAAKKMCSDKNLYNYLFSNIEYPPIARENNVEGMVYIQFVVETDGTVTNARIVRDIGAGCGEEALRIVNKMNNMPKLWSPGKQRNRPVRVLFTLPIRFQLMT